MATRAVLIHGTPILNKRRRRQNDSSESFEVSWEEKGDFDSVAADLTLCTAVDGFSLTNATNSRSLTEAFPQIYAPPENISLCSIGDNLHIQQTLQKSTK